MTTFEHKQKLEALGINIGRIVKSGKVLCPQCSQDRKKKKDPCLSVNLVTGQYNCHNPGCDFKGSVSDFKSKVIDETPYIRPTYNNFTRLPDKVTQFFENRGISQKTLIECKLTVSKMWISGVEKGVFQFNYFRNGELINIKHRTLDKEFRMEKGAEMIFYGLDDIKSQTEIIIVEGEMDKLALWEVGIKNVVSVPNGATMSDNADLKYLDNCLEYFEQAEKVILATDNDTPGFSLREQLARRLGTERCYKVNMMDCKDANDFLIKYPSSVKKAFDFENLIPYPIEGIVSIDEILDDIELLHAEGPALGATTKVLEVFDKHFTFIPGQLTMVTGVPGHGKSSLVDELAILLSLNRNWKWGIVAPESWPLSIHVSKLARILIGKNFFWTERMSGEEKEMAVNYIKNNFYFIQPEKGYNLDYILQKAGIMVNKFGINGLIIDPWNKLEWHQPSGVSETNYISQQLDKIINFNHDNLVHTMLIAHPTKMKRAPNGSYEVPTLYDISGSANFFNKTDNGFCVYREYVDGINDKTTVHIQKVKNDYQGHLGKVKMYRVPIANRFLEDDMKVDTRNWLLEDSMKQQKISFTMEDIGRGIPNGFNVLPPEKEEEFTF